MRYLKLFVSLFRHSAKRYLENKGSTVGNIAFMTLNFFLQIYLLEIMFMHTRSIAGWSKPEVFLVTGLFRLFSTFFSLFFQRSINHLVTEIPEGNLDLILTKPFSSQFYYSFYLIRSFELLNLIAPVVLVAYAISGLSLVFGWQEIISMVILLSCGLIIFYSIYISIASLTFWVGRFQAFASLFNILTIPLTFPTDIYGKNINFLLTFFLPLAFLVTIPAKIFLGKIGIIYLGIGIGFAFVCLLISIFIWNEAIKRYSSASS